MITEQDLKQKCTPEIIKKMVELAEGFEYYERQITIGKQLLTCQGIKYSVNSCETTHDFKNQVTKFSIFPLLIHRAVEGWNKEHINDDWSINISCEDVLIHYWNCGEQELRLLKQFKNYQPTTLTHAECAMFDCLINLLKD